VARVSGANGVTSERGVLEHVVVVGGTAENWASFGAAAWRERIDACRTTLGALGVRHVTIRPVSGSLAHDDRAALIAELLEATDGTELEGHGVVDHFGDEPMVLVSPDGEGRQRFAAAVAHLAETGTSPEAIDEPAVAGVLLAPGGVEPDLIVVLGPPNRLPVSLVWELAYAELVFLDVPWEVFDPTNLTLAVDEFRRRDRRFGGIDA
jgi:hypothetical protein